IITVIPRFWVRRWHFVLWAILETTSIQRKSCSNDTFIARFISGFLYSNACDNDCASITWIHDRYYSCIRLRTHCLFSQILPEFICKLLERIRRVVMDTLRKN
ncbi:hypothetical protein pdam_00003637, partial [Pocillopora damicornis]